MNDSIPNLTADLLDAEQALALDALLASLFTQEVTVTLLPHEWSGIVAACEMVSDTMSASGQMSDFVLLKNFTDKMWRQVISQSPAGEAPQE